MKLLNAFSLNTLASLNAKIRTTEVLLEYAKDCLAIHGGVESMVGDIDTANVFSSVLGLPVPMNRATVQLRSGDGALVGQYIGPRLPKGATALPEGATIKWVLIDIM